MLQFRLEVYFMDVRRLTALALSLAAGLLTACGEAQAPVVHKASAAGSSPAQRSHAFHAVALGSGTGMSSGLHDAADLVPDADPAAPSAWGGGLRPSRGASGISP